MSTISEFYGIKISVLHNEQSPHQYPHFLATYEECVAVFQSNGCHIIGKMPKTAKKLIRTWAKEHKESLYDAWLLAAMDEQHRQIRGLR